MSQVYNTEPPTSGKVRPRRALARCSATSSCLAVRLLHARACAQVILKTSLGDLDIELWPKEAPKARLPLPHLSLRQRLCGSKL